LIGGILATDMVHHSEATKKLSGVADMKNFDHTVEADRQQVVNMIIHTADLSAQAFPRAVAQSWEQRIVREFQNEVAHEEKLGIPVAKFMQGLDDPRLRAGLQVNFILYVLLPWWSNVARLLPELNPMLEELRSNREYYEAVAAGTIAPVRDTFDPHAPLPSMPSPHTHISLAGAVPPSGGTTPPSSPRPIWPESQASVVASAAGGAMPSLGRPGSSSGPPSSSRLSPLAIGAAAVASTVTAAASAAAASGDGGLTVKLTTPDGATHSTSPAAATRVLPGRVLKA